MITETEMAVPLVDVAWQHRQVRDTIDHAIDQLLTDTTCDGVEYVQALEASFAAWHGGDLHAIGVQSGLAAELLILKASGIGAGDEVITAPNSDLATTAAIGHAGATFTLVDIDPETFNIDPHLVESAVTPRTRAIMPVHMYGLPAEMDPILDIAKRNDLLVIEDATLALGAGYRGKPAGTVGDAGFFSFAPRKVLGGAGNGGMIMTRDTDLARRIRLLRAYGLDPERGDKPIAQRLTYSGNDHLVEGYNLKLDSMQAAIVAAKFACIDAWHERRQAVADRYNERFATVSQISTPVVPPHMCHAWRNYVVRVPERNIVRSRMLEQGIATAVLYIPPVHLQSVYHDLGHRVGDFPNAEAVAADLLALPMHPGMELEQVDYVADELIDALAAG